MVEKKKAAPATYVVIKIGGAQKVVRENDILEVPRTEGKEGTKLTAKDILLVASSGKLKIGTPLVADTKVIFKILEHSKGRKIEIRKFRAKSRHRRKTSHRQPITKVLVEKIKT